MDAFLLTLLLQAAGPVAAIPVPEPVTLPPTVAVDAEGQPVPDADEIAERQRLNAEQIAKAAAAQAEVHAKQAETAAAERAHQAALGEHARQLAEYNAARAAYEQRQREIADYNACYVEKIKARCPPAAK